MFRVLTGERDNSQEMTILTMHPAEMLLRQLRYPYKFLLIALVFFVPLGFASHALLSRIDDDLAFSRKEQNGLVFVEQLGKLLRDVREHRGVSQLAYRNPPGDSVRLAKLAENIDLSIQEIHALLATAPLSGEQNLLSHWEEASNLWARLRDENRMLSPQHNFARHTEIVARLQGAMRAIVRTSGLAFDPDPLNHPLAASLTGSIPMLGECLGLARGKTVSALGRGIMAPQLHYELSKLVGDCITLRGTLLDDLRGSFSAEDELPDGVRHALNESMLRHGAFLKPLERLLVAPQDAPDIETLFAAGTAAVNSTDALGGTLVSALRTALEERTETQARRRRDLIAVSLVVLGLAGYLFVTLSRTLIVQIETLRQSAQAVAEGRLDVSLTQPGNDEIADVARLFDSVVGTLREQIAKVRDGEARLRESEKRIRALFNSGNDPVFVFECDHASGTPSGNFIEINEIACVRLGYSRDELLAMNPEHIVPNGMQVLPGMNLALNRSAVFESAHRTRNNDVIPVEVGAHLFELDGRALVIAVARDITERKASEAKQILENELAQGVIDRLGRRHGLEDPSLRYRILPAEGFSGDIIASARSPAGVLHALLADATGHGLTAAISVIPVLTLFYRLVEQGVAMPTLVSELNRELMETLPTGRFVAATLLAVDPVQRSVTLWQGGTPEVLQIDAAGSVKARHASSQLPLGIVRFDDDDLAPSVLTVAPGDRLVLFSDGLIEAEDAQREAFGIERIEATLQAAKGEPLDDLLRALTQHIGTAEAHDDITILIVDCAGHHSVIS